VQVPFAAGDDGEGRAVSPLSLQARVRHSREQRAGLFAAWLVHTFTAARLRGEGRGRGAAPGATVGVLDVAGGQGDVALALQLDHGIPAVLVDPVRPSQHTHTHTQEEA
jgi:hypothetical protein